MVFTRFTQILYTYVYIYCCFLNPKEVMQVVSDGECYSFWCEVSSSMPRIIEWIHWPKSPYLLDRLDGWKLAKFSHPPNLCPIKDSKNSHERCSSLMVQKSQTTTVWMYKTFVYNGISTTNLNRLAGFLPPTVCLDFLADKFLSGLCWWWWANEQWMTMFPTKRRATGQQGEGWAPTSYGRFVF